MIPFATGRHRLGWPPVEPSYSPKREKRALRLERKAKKALEEKKERNKNGIF